MAVAYKQFGRNNLVFFSCVQCIHSVLLLMPRMHLIEAQMLTLLHGGAVVRVVSSQQISNSKKKNKLHVGLTKDCFQL